VVNCKVENTTLGFGVTELWNKASIAAGMNGVGDAVAVLVTRGVSVMVGVSVIVGTKVIEGTTVMVGVKEGVGEGGKYSYAKGKP
jgi:hypothetical protein